MVVICSQDMARRHSVGARMFAEHAKKKEAVVLGKQLLPVHSAHHATGEVRVGGTMWGGEGGGGGAQCGEVRVGGTMWGCVNEFLKCLCRS